MKDNNYPLTVTMSKPAEKVCKVCGDRAIGFNFSVMTCESCKSFFRRNASKMDTFKCRKTGTCEVDDSTRKCCPKCRLSKCFQMGMRKEIINSSLEAAARRRSYSCTTSMKGRGGGKRKSGSFHHQQQQHSPEPEQQQLPPQISQPSPPSSSSASLSSLHLPQISPTPSSPTNSSSSSSLTSPFIPGNPLLSIPSLSLQSLSLSDSLNIPTSSASLQLTPNIFVLSDWERQEIATIQEATEVAGFFEESTFQVVGEMTNLIEALNLAELYITKTIKFCKHFPLFRAFPQDDQLLLLKDFFTELMLVRICYVFVPDKDAFVVIQDEEKRTAVYVSLRILYQAQKQELLNYCREKSWEFQIEMEKDPCIRDLILLQRLFKPREPGDACSAGTAELIAAEYLKYEGLLRRYLTVKYGGNEAAAEAKMDRFEDAYQALALCRQMMESIYVYSGANQLAMLIKEIYNLI
ncbi:Ligand binding domain of hormone receptors protein [Tyrophagus putrescentiae]|nr:Ligand binding domain of hormone receptors protein [Tyrophagus putrescentiae]